jgi:hypothetical protein
MMPEGEAVAAKGKRQLAYKEEAAGRKKRRGKAETEAQPAAEELPPTPQKKTPAARKKAARPRGQ